MLVGAIHWLWLPISMDIAYGTSMSTLMGVVHKLYGLFQWTFIVLWQSFQDDINMRAHKLSFDYEAS
jgi:hypothetical protein